VEEDKLGVLAIDNTYKFNEDNSFVGEDVPVPTFKPSIKPLEIDIPNEMIDEKEEEKDNSF
jgi:hypothetical protein